MIAPRQKITRVVLWMSGALLSFCVMAVSIRALATSLSIVEILTLRAGVGLAIIAIILAFRPELRRSIVRRRLGLHALRNTIHFGAQYLWAMSLLLLPLATVFALEFTMPAWTMLLAAIFLGERMTASRAGAIILGLAGVFVILRPSVASFQPAALLVLAAALGYAAQNIATKTLVEEWAAKEKVDVTIDYIPSQGMKNLITIAAESQARSGGSLSLWWR